MVKKIKNELKYIDKPLLTLCLIMVCFGLLNIVTSSSREAATWDVSLYYYFYRQIVWIVAGGLLALIIMNIPTKKYNYWVMIGLVLVILALLYANIDPTFHRGSARWINLFGFVFQPGEFTKPFMVLLSVLFFDQYKKLVKRKPQEAKKILNLTFFVCLLIPLLIFLQRDFGNAIIVGMIFLFCFLISDLDFQKKINYLFILVIVILIGALASFIHSGRVLEPHQLSRFNFLSPCTNYEHTGYQICNAYIAINEGGLFGVGIGESRQKYSYIDEPHTDMVFAIIIEEYGALFAGLILLVYTGIMLRIIHIGRSAKQKKLRYIAYGLMFYMFLQIFINLGGLFGLIPLTGVTLPFLSYGGSFTIAFLMGLGVVFRISIENRLAKIKIKKI